MVISSALGGGGALGPYPPLSFEGLRSLGCLVFTWLVVPVINRTWVSAVYGGFIGCLVVKYQRGFRKGMVPIRCFVRCFRMVGVS